MKADAAEVCPVPPLPTTRVPVAALPMFVASVEHDAAALVRPAQGMLDDVTLEDSAVPVSPEAGTAVAVIVPLPEAANDAPVPTTIAAAVFVPLVIALNAELPLPPQAEPASTILPFESTSRQWPFVSVPLVVPTVPVLPLIAVIPVPLILKTFPVPAVS